MRQENTYRHTQLFYYITRLHVSTHYPGHQQVAAHLEVGMFTSVTVYIFFFVLIVTPTGMNQVKRSVTYSLREESNRLTDFHEVSYPLYTI